MMINTAKFFREAVFLLLIAIFSRCQSTDRQALNQSPNFLLTGTSPGSSNTSLLALNDLSTDSVSSPERLITYDHKWVNEQWVINRGNAFYSIDQEKFFKLSFVNNNIEDQGSIPFPLFSRICWYQWRGQDTLLIGGNNTSNDQLCFAYIDCKNMRLVQTGSFKIPSPPKGMQLYACSGVIRNNKFYLGYSVIDPDGSGRGKYATDTAYLATMSYPGFDNVDLSKDTRSTFPGSGRAGNSCSVLLNGDLYILSSPVDWNGQNTAKPTGFFRIKEGANTFDKDYFFNLSKLLDNDDPDALIDLGNGKVIVRSAKHHFVQQWSDWSKEITQYVLVDLIKQTVKPLDLPLFVISAGGLAKNGVAYLPVITKASGTIIYAYDPSTDKLSKSVSIKGFEKFGKIYNIK